MLGPGSLASGGWTCVGTRRPSSVPQPFAARGCAGTSSRSFARAVGVGEDSVRLRPRIERFTAAHAVAGEGE